MKVFRMIVLTVLLLGNLWGCASHKRVVRHATETTPKELHQTLLFDFNGTAVHPEDQSKLESVARWLARDKKSMVIIEGHTDQIGDARYNDILSEDRARSVRVTLRDQGADPRRMTILSKGEREPLVKGHDRRALQPNRRVEITLSLTHE